MQKERYKEKQVRRCYNDLWIFFHVLFNAKSFNEKPRPCGLRLE